MVCRWPSHRGQYPRHLLFLLALLLPALSLKGRGIEELPSLQADEAKQLKQEIAENLRSSRSRGVLAHPLRFVVYRVKSGEDFFAVVTRLSQDPDTLASLNGLAHPAAVGPGDRLLVANARGVFREDPESGGVKVQVGEGRSAYFLAGRRFSNRERDYFRGIVFVHPLAGARLTSGYGWRRDPLNGRQGFHAGLDLAAPEGTAVVAAGPGKVVFSGDKGGYGRCVLIQHEFGYVTVYGHLSRTDVKVGQVVRRSERIGRVGRTGRVTGPHLHYEVWKRGRHRPPDFDHPHT